MPKFVEPIDMQGLEVLNFTPQKLATAPTHLLGRVYYDTVLNALRVSNGTTWATMGEGMTTEDIQDIIGAALAGTGLVSVTYNDATGTITIATTATANSSDATLLARANHTGTQSADTITDGTTNKAYTATEKTKLGGIATGATANATDAQLRDRSTHTGTQSADTLTDGTTNKAFLATERTKLSGIATNATANSPDATLLARGNHTGTQLAATISDFTTAVDARVANVVGAAPTALDTLVELSAALGNDANFATTVTNSIATKAGKYSVDLGNGSLTSFTVTHNLNTLDIVASIRIKATGEIVYADVTAATVNTATVAFAIAPTAAQYRITVLG